MIPSKIQITSRFQAQYTLLIEMDSMLVNASMKSKTEARYDFSVLSIFEIGFECRLVQLDLFMHEANNGLINEVAELTAAFNRMFNELHLKISHSGVVMEVLNMDLILSKWNQTKKLMQNAADKNPEVKDLISVSDNLFTNADKIKLAIQANEFIQTYFGYVFDANFPLNRQDSNRTNFFNTAYLPFFINAELTEVYKNNSVKVSTSAHPAVSLDKDFCKNAYKSFEDKVNVTAVKPVIKEESVHHIESASGKMISAEVNKQELVAENLFNKTTFRLELENRTAEEVSGKVDLQTAENDNTNSRFKFF